MIQWQHLFAVPILNRGREYFRKNKVRSLIRDGDTAKGFADRLIAEIEGK